MLVFGVGAALPLLIMMSLSREVLQRWRKPAGKAALGVLLIVLVLSIRLTARSLEARRVRPALQREQLVRSAGNNRRWSDLW
jgi:cytochrome c biogenesis protein CcdA